MTIFSYFSLTADNTVMRTEVVEGEIIYNLCRIDLLSVSEILCSADSDTCQHGVIEGLCFIFQ